MALPRSTAALLLAAFATAMPARGVEVVGSGSARFSWEAAEGPVAAYAVLVSRNGAPARIERAVLTPSTEVRGALDETVVVSVAAIGRDASLGPTSAPSLPVRFTDMPSPPVIGVDPALLVANATLGEAPPSLAVEVVNSGGGTLDFEVETMSPWLSATPAQGSSSTAGVPIRLDVDPSSLAPGLHLSAAFVRDRDAGAGAATVGVLLSVWPEIPRFSGSPTSVSISAPVGGAPARASFELTASLESAPYFVASEASWLRSGLANDVPQTGSRTISIEADPAGLTRGAHTARLHVIPADERSSPAFVDVTLTVEDPLAPRRTGADLDADGDSDLVLLDRSSGEVSVWLMKGAQRFARATLEAPTPSEDWTIVALGDVDGDRRADLVWRYETLGVGFFWTMDGTNERSRGALPWLGEPGWTLAAADDFDDDGRFDLAWHDRERGRIRITSAGSGTAFSSYEPQLEGEEVAAVIGTGDFDASGTADVLWWSRSGAYRIWISTPDGAGRLVPLEPPYGAGYEIACIGDLDGDEKSDIVWRDASLRESRLMRFESATRFEDLALPDLRRSGWKIDACSDLDGNGTSDLVWRNLATPQLTIWLMQGTSVQGGGSAYGGFARGSEIHP